MAAAVIRGSPSSSFLSIAFADRPTMMPCARSMLPDTTCCCGRSTLAPAPQLSASLRSSNSTEGRPSIRAPVTRFLYLPTLTNHRSSANECKLGELHESRCLLGGIMSRQVSYDMPLWSLRDAQTSSPWCPSGAYVARLHAASVHDFLPSKLIPAVSLYAP